MESDPESSPDLDQLLGRVSGETWTDPPRPGLLIDGIRATERRRFRRTLLFAAPCLLALGACVAYGTYVHIHRIEAEVDLFVDGESQGIRKVQVHVEGGELQPLELTVDGLGTVNLELEVPPGIEPRSLDGMRLRAMLTTSPDRDE